MTARPDTDRLLTAWLQDAAPAREPEHLLGEVLARTARTRRRPAWRNPERWNPMSAITSRLTPISPVPWRLIAVGAALLIALAVGLLVAGGALKKVAPPYGLASNGHLAYAVDGDVVIADGPGAAPRTVVGGPATDWLPIYSLDGSRLIFLRGPESAAEVWAASADGSSPRKLAGPFSQAPTWIDWSPDDKVLAFNGIGPSNGSITLVQADGSGTSTIETGLQAAEMATFRPITGAQLSLRGQDAAGHWGVYLVNRDGTGLVHLNLDPGFLDDPYYPENSPYYFNDLTWDSTGTRVAYHTLEPDASSPAGPGFRIHVADIDGAGAVSGERILVFDPAADDEFSPGFIPGTHDIVFRSLEGSTHKLFRGSTEPGGKATYLGISGADWIGVSISPDGRQLVATIPDAPATASGNASKHTVIVDLATLVQTPLSLPDDFSWQRVAGGS